MSRPAFDEAIESRMLADDPTLTGLSLLQQGPLNLLNVGIADRLDAALSRSTHLSGLYVDLDMITDETNGAILQRVLDKCIVYSTALHTLALVSRSMDWAAVVDCLHNVTNAVGMRRSLGQNPLKRLLLQATWLDPDSIGTLLQKSRLEKVDLCCFDVLDRSFSSREVAIRHVAHKFSMSTSLERVNLSATLANEDYVCAIIRALESLPRFLELGLVPGDADTMTPLVLKAVATFITLSQSHLTVTISLDGFYWTEESFTPIAASLENAATENYLSLSSGRMDDSACGRLRSIYAKGKEVGLLLSGSMSFPKASRNQTLSSLVGSTAGLNMLGLLRFDDTALQRRRFRAIVSCLSSKSCAIQELCVLHQVNDTHMPVLLNAIPTLHSVQSIQFQVENDNLKEQVMKALRRNRSLLHMFVEGDCFDDSDHSRMKVYADRNRGLPIAIKSEATTMTRTKATGNSGGKDDISRTTATSTGKLLPALFMESMRSVVPVGVSHLIGGLVWSEDAMGAPQTASGKRIIRDSSE